MAKEFPEIKEKNEGKFTAWAKNNGFKDACSAASAVMKNKKKYKPSVVKMANYAENFGCSTKKSPMTKIGNPKGDSKKQVTPPKKGELRKVLNHPTGPKKRPGKKH